MQKEMQKEIQEEIRNSPKLTIILIRHPLFFYIRKGQTNYKL